MMKTDFSVRTAVLEDGPRISALLSATYPLEFARCYSQEILRVALPLMTRANLQLLASGTYYVAEIPSGLMVACGGWTMARPGTGETVTELGHIRHFATHPLWARQGIGRALVSRCFQDARGRGVKSLECMSSLVAESFYRAMGFEMVRSINVELNLEVSLPALLMRREI